MSTPRPRHESGAYAPRYAPDDLHPDPTGVRRRLRSLLAARKRAREAGPRTLAEVCEVADVSAGDVSPRLGGMRPLPWSMVERLAKGAGVDVADIA